MDSLALATWLADGSAQRGRERLVWCRQPHGVMLLAAGIRWDAVKIPAKQGRWVHSRLQGEGAPLGPVLWDRMREQMYFLVPAGFTRLWDGSGVRIVTSGGWLAAPDPCRFLRRAVWLPCVPDGRLTSPEQLGAAIRAVVPACDAAPAAG